MSSICEKVRGLSLFCDQEMLLKVHFVMKDPDHALCGESERLPHGHRFCSLVCKNTAGDQGTPLSPQQFDSSTVHDQPFVPAELISNKYTVSRLLFECVVGV